MTVPFTDRRAAGRQLAARLLALHLPPPFVVLALPRGGVPVAVPVARALGAPLDLLLVRKIGLPWQPELALAALVEGEPPQRAVDQALRSVSGVDADYLARQQREALAEIARRRAAYLAGRPVVPVAGCTAIVVDDGIATGTTMRAALRGLRQRHPARLVLAVPVAPADTVQALRDEVDDLVCLAQPEPFHAVGLHYRDFHQLDDAEVLAALAEAAAAGPAQGPDAARP